jgi:ATP-dependent DNA ligase
VSTPASWVWKASSSKRADRAYAPGDRGIWVKSKCLNREEFVVVGWTDPEGSREHIGALLLGYYTEDGRLHGHNGEGAEANFSLNILAVAT